MADDGFVEYSWKISCQRELSNGTATPNSFGRLHFTITTRRKCPRAPFNSWLFSPVLPADLIEMSSMGGKRPVWSVILTQQFKVEFQITNKNTIKTFRVTKQIGKNRLHR